MNLHSKQFESGLKSRIKQIIRESPSLKKEHKRVKRARRARRNWVMVWVYRLAVTGLLSALVWREQENTGHMTSALAAFSLYLTFIVLFRMQRVWGLLRDSQDIPALMLLPVETATIFRWQKQKFIRESFFSLADILVVTGVLVAINDLPPWEWIFCLLFAVLAWAQTVVWAVWGALHIPRKVFTAIYSSMILGGAVLFFGRSIVGPPALRFLDEHARELLHFLPIGWAVSPFEIFCPSGEGWPVLLWLPGIFAAFHIKKSLPALASHLEYHEFIIPQPPEQVPDDEGHFEVPEQKERPVGLSIIEDTLNSGVYLKQPGFVFKHPVERWLWNWLNPRQKAITEFIHPNGLNLRSNWKTIFSILLLTGSLVLAGGWFSYGLQLTAFCGGTFFIFCACLAALMSHGRAFMPMWMNGVGVPLYAAYGIGFNELSGVFAKFLMIQMPAVAVVFMLLGAMAAMTFRLPVQTGVMLGLETAGLVAGLGFIVRVFSFSSGTNDTSRFRLESVFLVGLMVVMGLVFLGCGCVALVEYQYLPLASLMSLTGALLDSYLFWWVYSLFYRYGRFDLMAVPKQ